MSLLPLTAAALALSFFEQPLPVQDYSYEKASGIDKKVAYGKRQRIMGATDPSGGQRLEQIFGGNVSQGDIGIWTRETLYIADIYEEGETPKQTIVTYGGRPYLIKDKSDWAIQAGVRVYLAARHVDQG